MKDPYLLHMFNPTKNVSPFDVNMAYEAAYNAVIPYTDVGLEDIHALTQDTIFSRGPTGVKRTGIFIGGRDFGLAIDMLEAAKKAMVPPFEVSVFADPSGAITTAAALVAAVESCIKKQGRGGLAGKNIHVFGGTGPVGVCAGILASGAGANIFVASSRGAEAGSRAAEPYNRRYGVSLCGADSGSEAGICAILDSADIVVGAAKAGVQILSKTQLATAHRLLVAADVNAVPPSGIEGVGVQDMGKVLDYTPARAVGIGALAIGNLKYKVHYRLFQIMIEAQRAVYIDHNKAFEVAREYAAAL
ncbi:MAG: NAD(P)-dependent methylenetetrahydromethanopterin dehydrogenase [Gammaproteobacteria bacterium]